MATQHLHFDRLLVFFWRRATGKARGNLAKQASGLSLSLYVSPRGGGPAAHERGDEKCIFDEGEFGGRRRRAGGHAGKIRWAGGHVRARCERTAHLATGGFQGWKGGLGAVL